jgi:hypothetical protein
MRLTKAVDKFLQQKRLQSSSASRKGFGSFHSEDVEVLIRQSEADYHVPEVYDEVLSKSFARNSSIIDSFQFGHTAKNDLFSLGNFQTFLQCYF